MNNEKGNRLPKISLWLSLGPIAAYIATYLYISIESFDSSGDWGYLGLLLLLWQICSVLQLCCASAGMALSIYAVTQKIHMKTSVTALVFSVLSLVMSLIIITITFRGFIGYF